MATISISFARTDGKVQQIDVDYPDEERGSLLENLSGLDYPATIPNPDYDPEVEGSQENIPNPQDEETWHAAVVVGKLRDMAHNNADKKAKSHPSIAAAEKAARDAVAAKFAAVNITRNEAVTV